MARARKGGRKTLRDLQDEAAAVEAREKEPAEEEEEEGEEEAETEAEEGDEGDEDAPKKAKAKPKKKAAVKKPAAAKKPAAKRVRTPKEVRTRAVWVVFDNGSKRIKEFPYPQKADADQFLAEKQEEKKGTFYINLVKDEIKE